MLPLAFLMAGAGMILLVAGVTGSSLGSVVKGAPDGANTNPEASPAGVTGSLAAGPGGTAPAPSTLSSGGSAEQKKILHEIAKQLGWSPVAWEEIIQKESGWSTTAANPTTGAYGIGQLNPENAANPAQPRPGSTASQYPGYHGNFDEQIKAQAYYIAKTYGNPSAALTFHESHGYY